MRTGIRDTCILWMSVTLSSVREVDHPTTVVKCAPVKGFLINHILLTSQLATLTRYAVYTHHTHITVIHVQWFTIVVNCCW